MNALTEADIIAKYNEIITNAPIDEMDEVLREIDNGLIEHLSTEAKNKINEYRQRKITKQLPIIKIGHKSFFKDDRLKQYRNTKDPHEFYSFDEMDTVLRLIDPAEQLINSIKAEAEKLGISIHNGQSMMNNEDIMHLITPDEELITVIRTFAPDDEILEEIIGSE